MHYPIIALNFICYHPLTLHLDHYSKIFDHLPSYWCDGTKKIALQVGDGSEFMIVNA